MADPNDVQALENISSVVNNFQLKNLISSRCIKAQAFLFNKLTKQSERQKEICRFISNSNLKLETEITLAEQEIKSLRIAIEMIKLGNIELNKEYLLSKERKADVFERIKTGMKKYENLWLVSEKRYQTIPNVQKLIQMKKDNEIIHAKINAFIDEYHHLENQIKIKKNNFENIDRARIIELARYFVEERSQMLLKINENDLKIKQVLNEIEMLIKDQKNSNYDISQGQQLLKAGKQSEDTIQDSSLGDNWPDLSKTAEKDTLMLPKLPSPNNELDILTVKLDELKKVDLQNTLSMKRAASFTSNDNSHKMCKIVEMTQENVISSYFDISLDKSAGNDNKNIDSKKYSEKKLIHILEDIKLDKKDAFKIMNKLEPSQLQETKYIHRFDNIYSSQGKENKSLEIEEIVDLTEKTDTAVVKPPSQFLDSQTPQRTPEEKKTESYITPIEKETPKKETEESDKESTKIDVATSEEIGMTKSQEKSILNNSTTSDDNYTIFKDMLLKKHNLDLSPVFVYSKNTLMQKQREDEVTSKFFEENAEVTQQHAINAKDDKTKEDKILKTDESKPYMSLSENVICTRNYNVSSPKEHIRDTEHPVSGFLFNHGPEGIPDSLNVSINTTGLEDCEDFPHCMDSSLLLSPKANIPTNPECSNNNEVLSQEVPNFLTGFRKTGISFFGSATSSDKQDPAAQCSSGSFSFTFANEEKKGRGGLFSMFH